MAFDITPRNLWNFPSIVDEDDDWSTISHIPSGLSVSEEDTQVYIEAAMPGIKPEAIEMTFDKGMLWIKGGSNEEDKNKNK